MRFLAYTCRCGADLAHSKPGKVFSRGKGEDKVSFAYCPAGCGRSWPVDSGPPPETETSEPEPEETGGSEEEDEGSEEEGEGSEEPEETT